MENNSRLDRLFILLKSGSSATRNSASSQLGRLTSSNPEGLPHLLSRLAVVFKSPDWEARIAAGHALGEILKNLSPWDPSNSCSSGSSAVSSLSAEESPSTSTSALSERLSFESLCLDHILSQGTFLRSESKPEADSSSLQEQRSHLEDTLGLPSKELVSNEDLLTHPETCSSPPPPKRLKWDFQSSPPGPEDSLLSPFIQDMFRELFAESWEVRHGSSTALREIIKYHGDVGGTKRHLSVHQNKALHREWLRELAVKFLCLLALDRFGDFASDTVVAPVRETGAQALGYVAKWMEEEDVGILVQSLLSLMERKEWQCRHGGLLAVKYLLALREEQTTESLLAQIFPSVFAGLTDSMDDVVSVAASSLLPVTDILPSCLSKSQLSDLTNRLWESLLDLDDLTASTHSLIKLLSNLLVSLGDNLSSVLLSTSSELVPRIYPLLSHTSSLVRQSSLEALETLISTQDLSSSFLPQTIKDLSIHLFQRALLEHQPQNLELIESVWRHACRHTPIGDLLLATCPLYGPWLLLVSQPPSWPLSLKCGPSPLYLGGPEAQHTTDPEEKSAYMMRARILACRLLGFLAGFVVQRVPNMTYTEDPMNQFVGKIILPNLLNSRSAYHRTTICLVISEWEALCPPFDKSSLPETLKAAFLRFLAEAVSYDETISAFKALQSEASDLWANLKHYNIPLNVVSSPLTYEHIQSISDIPDEAILRSNKIRPKAKTSLTERKAGLSSALGSIKKEQSSLCTMTQAVIAGSAISLRALPEKLHPVIKPLMESIKKESNAQLQSKAATKLADIMEICTEKSPSSNDKIIKNLITFASSDNLLTPELIEEVRDEGILSHFLREKSKSLSLKSRKNGSKSTEEDASIGLSLRLKNEIQRRGAISALQAIVRKFGNLLELKIPKLWDSTVSLATSPPPTNSVNVVVKALQALEVMIPSLHTDLTPSLEVAVQTLCRSHAKASSSSLRYMASRVIAEIALLIPKVTLTAVIKTILPALESTELNERRGGIEVIICILDRLGIKIVPYIVLLLVPVLGRMSDNDSQVRLLASNCFATLVRLMPLDNDTTNGGGSTSNGHDDLYYSQEILEKKNSERKFIHQLMDAKNAEYFHIPEKVMSTELLRSYQRSGVNWLAFLNRYKLHGILCDDMGLGKTLQSICVLAGDHYNRAQNIQACSLPSLVICPPTLRWHWKEEILKFTKDKFLSPLLYNGSARSDFEGHNVVVTSYDLVRKDVEFLKGIQWNYIILDEGHVIKNAKTKTTLAIKSLNSQHRLILSGTPIQNSVLEIWSLFDFLMPGYLGSERDFSSKFSRPIIASRESKCSKRDKEAGALATESLHRQILPFVLRRMKEDVLKDLPPKITQDYYCDLSPLQVQLYEEYTLKQKLGDLEGGESSSKAGLKSHIFQALQYLRKVCNHPKLVSDELKESQDISVAAKLPALRDLLLECGIGIMDDGGGGEEATNLASQHRALIFFQLKSMMNIVEVDLLKRLMPSVTYLRLDGSVPTNKRHDIVQRFNNDVSIDLLLLSTSVGGLGLNLTGADTVIFAEHDWNPMKDLQAMDRAHRIGQKKVVNVYRLITRNTIEEKILGLQKFKLKTANTVISSENSSIESMGTDQIFDLFSLEDKEDGGGEDSQSNSSKKKSGIKSILNSLPELWDEKQYEEEYDLNTFITKNKSSS